MQFNSGTTGGSSERFDKDMKVCLACKERFARADWCCPACGHAPMMRDGRPVLAPTLEQTGDDYDVRFFDRLAALEPGNYWFEARNRLVVWALGRFFSAARSFLDIGCGTGFVLLGIHTAFPALRLTGADAYSDGLVHAGARLPGAPFCQLDARHIPFDEEFDVVGAFDVLEHIEDDEVVLAEMFRTLRPGGGLVLTVPQHPALWSSCDADARHKRRYTRAELTRKLHRAGFQPEYMTSFVSFLLPMMFASRRAGRMARQNSDPLSELTPGPGANAILSGILGLERLLITHGVSFPAGGSLLAVARRPG